MNRFTSVLALIFFALLSESSQASGPVLVLGDERVQGRFGELLEQKLREKDGTPTARISACGFTVYDWLQGTKTACGYFQKKISGEITQSREAQVAPVITLLSEVKPEFLVFVHGNRGLDTTPKALQSQIALIGQLLAAHKTKCLWMGTGDEVSSKISSAYYDAVRMAATDAGCVIVDVPFFSTLMESSQEISEIEPLIDVVTEMISVGRVL